MGARTRCLERAGGPGPWRPTLIPSKNETSLELVVGMFELSYQLVTQHTVADRRQLS